MWRPLLSFIFAVEVSWCFSRVGFVAMEYRHGFVDPPSNMTACEWQAHFHKMDAKFSSYNFSTFADSTHIPQCTTMHRATDFGNKVYKTVALAMERDWLSMEKDFFPKPSTHNVVSVFSSFIEHRKDMEDRWEHRVALLATDYFFRQATDWHSYSLASSFLLVVNVAYLTSRLMALLALFIVVKTIVIPLYITIREWLRPTLTSPRFELWANVLVLLYIVALYFSHDALENFAQTKREAAYHFCMLFFIPLTAFFLWCSFCDEHKRNLERQEQEPLERERQERLQRKREEWERFQWEQAQQQRPGQEHDRRPHAHRKDAGDQRSLRSTVQPCLVEFCRWQHQRSTTFD